MQEKKYIENIEPLYNKIKDDPDKKDKADQLETEINVYNHIIFEARDRIAYFEGELKRFSELTNIRSESDVEKLEEFIDDVEKEDHEIAREDVKTIAEVVNIRKGNIAIIKDLKKEKEDEEDPERKKEIEEIIKIKVKDNEKIDDYVKKISIKRKDKFANLRGIAERLTEKEKQILLDEIDPKKLGLEDSDFEELQLEIIKRAAVTPDVDYDPNLLNSYRKYGLTQTDIDVLQEFKTPRDLKLSIDEYNKMRERAAAKVRAIMDYVESRPQSIAYPLGKEQLPFIEDKLKMAAKNQKSYTGGSDVRMDLFDKINKSKDNATTKKIIKLFGGVLPDNINLDKIEKDIKDIHVGRKRPITQTEEQKFFSMLQKVDTPGLKKIYEAIGSKLEGSGKNKK